MERSVPLPLLPLRRAKLSLDRVVFQHWENWQGVKVASAAAYVTTARGVGPVKSFFEQTPPFTSRSGLVRFVRRCIDDHRSLVICRATSVRPNHLVCWAARCSGGLKSLWCSNEERHIQESGGNSSLAGESGRYGDV